MIMSVITVPIKFPCMLMCRHTRKSVNQAEHYNVIMARVTLIFPFIACGGGVNYMYMCLTTHTNVPFQYSIFHKL